MRDLIDACAVGVTQVTKHRYNMYLTGALWHPGLAFLSFRSTWTCMQQIYAVEPRLFT